MMMPRLRWLFVFALVTVALLTVGDGIADDHRPGADSQEDERHQAADDAQVTVGQPLEDQKSADDDAGRGEQEHEEGERIDQGLSVWGFLYVNFFAPGRVSNAVIALFTIVLAVVAALQFCLSRRIHRESEAALTISRQAAEAATKGAEAASLLARQAALTAERELRPYLFVGQMTGEFDEKTETFKIAIPWVNVGKTPAKRVRIGGLAVRMPATEGYDFKDPNEPRRECGDIGPGQDMVFNVSKHRSFWTGLDSPKDKVFIWGWADYSDTIPGAARRRTEFCFRVTYDPARPRALDFALDNRFNGSDETAHHRPAD